MKPQVEDILPLVAGLEPPAVEKHLAALDDNYFQRFDLPEIARHVERVSRLRPEQPLEVIFAHPEDGRIIECTVISYDHQGIFSLITGVFAATGFHIQSGETFTYRPLAAARPRGRRVRGRYRRPPAAGHRPIIDYFRGFLDVSLPVEVWGAEFSHRLLLLVQLLFAGRGDDGVRKARQRINEMVTQYLVANRQEQARMLYPVEIEIMPREKQRTVQLKVVAQDTPAFLFTLSNTLALQGLSIDYVRIRTVGDRVEDLLEISEPGVAGMLGPGGMEKLKLAVLLTKQFTYFLGRAPDPYAALTRFETLLPDILVHPDSRAWVNFLANPRAMDELAHVLGTSDFLWEDFIRLQYEMLLPILKSHLAGQEVFPDIETVDDRLQAAMAAGTTFEEKQRILNEFKNRELFLIDLHHIVDARTTFRDLAEDLTRLAEAIVRQAAATVYQHLVARYGRPQTVAGLEVAYAVFGLGKLGGAALGYASDIELLFVYDDNGETAGPQKITNSDFFSQLAAGVAAFIVTKKKGIFAIDYRLRPYGESGPLGVSLENFCRYYGPGGPAHSYERLALVRLRWIGGDRELGARIERLRDQYIYESDSIDLEELSALRRKQFKEKERPGVYNAKFSPGALVDIEYSVQILQVISRGGGNQLRTPRVHEALTALRDSGILGDDECRQLNAAYDFLRQLINALRMLRGSAEDLYLPPVEADEFTHLARRMGYQRHRDFSAARQLMVDFATHTAIVRSFVERHLGRKPLPAPTMGNVADLILNDRLSPERRQAIMGKYGFANVERACTNFLSLAGEGERRELFVKLAVLACDILRRESAPDLALNNWERFVASLADPVAHYNLLFSQPRRLEILLGIFSRSQFLANTLIRQPDFLAWVTAHETLYGQRTKAQ
ncbi:MAG: glutamate-ammonia-ligase adenylyltransferase, partial [Deltaproteobacteria bacterium]|nr:glutamate-ammonia-ligase adenylyltransferase [Deltaproteobacteria bacterium]